MLLSSVLLPAPLRPTQATTWLRRTRHIDVEQRLRFAVGDVEPARPSGCRRCSSCDDGPVLLGADVDLPIAAADFGVVEGFLVAAVGDHVAFVHDGEPLQEILRRAKSCARRSGWSAGRCAGAARRARPESRIRTRPASGSSSSSTFGSVKTAMAISSRRFSPRLRFFTSRSRTPCRSKVSSASTIFGSLRWLLQVLSSSASIDDVRCARKKASTRLSMTLRLSNVAVSWNVRIRPRATRCCGVMRVMSSPL